MIQDRIVELPVSSGGLALLCSVFGFLFAFDAFCKQYLRLFQFVPSLRTESVSRPINEVGQHPHT